MKDEYLRTDAGSHFLDCLYFVERQLGFASSNSKEWHWTIIGLASLAQSSCVIFLDERDTAQVLTLSKKSMKKTMESFKQTSLNTLPTQHMAPPLELIERVLNWNGTNHFLGSSANKISISESSSNDLKKVFNIRNQFTHFNPMLWSIELIGLPRISREVILFCKQVLETPGLYQRLSAEHREEAMRICDNLILSCEEMSEAPVES